MSTLSRELGNEIKSIRREIIFADIAILVLGLIMVIFPEASANVICRAAGVIMCFFGFVRIVTYFSGDRMEVLGSFALVQGAALLGFGIYFLIKPQFLAAFLTVVLAIILIVGGVMKFQYTVDFMRLNASLWWIELIGTVIMAVLGIVVLCNPFSAAKTLMVFIGISFLIDGIWDMVSIIYLSSFAKRVKKDVKRRMDAANTESYAQNAEFTDDN